VAKQTVAMASKSSDRARSHHHNVDPNMPVGAAPQGRGVPSDDHRAF
jgi:hypothetical protein